MFRMSLSSLSDTSCFDESLSLPSTSATAPTRHRENVDHHFRSSGAFVFQILHSARRATPCFRPRKDRTHPGATHMAARAFETQWKHSRRFNFREFSFFGAQAEMPRFDDNTSANRNPRSHTACAGPVIETRFRCARNTVLMQSTELIAGLAALRCPDVLEMAVTEGGR